ncbi:MAG: LamG-like jellyroll fold domain-containing protein [Sedimentisphaeraceae bacterium JB056]
MLFLFIEDIMVVRFITFIILVLVAFSGINSYADTLAFWKFDEGSGQSLTDETGLVSSNFVRGTSTSDWMDPQWTTGICGNSALLFSSVSPGDVCSFINGYTPETDSAALVSSDFTVEAFVKISALPAEGYSYASYVVSLCDRSGTYANYWNYAIRLRTENSYTYAEGVSRASDGSWLTVTSSVPLSTGVVYHLAYSYDSLTEEAVVRVNGSSDSTVFSADPISDLLEHPMFTIGAKAPSTSYSSFFDGIIDEVRISDTVLADEQLINSPLALWKFDDSKSIDDAIARDSIKNILTSYYDGDVSIVNAGIDEKAAWFNGNASGVDLGTGMRNLLDGSNGITVQGWVRCADMPDSNSLFRPVFCSRINDAQAGIEIFVSYYAGATKIKVGARSSVSDSYQVCYTSFNTLDQWVHLACVSDFINDQIRVYVNGSLVCTENVSFSSELYSSGTVISQTDQIGRDCASTSFFRGWIDEVAVYGRALCLQEIQGNYNVAVPDEPESLWISEAFAESQTSDVYYGSPSLVLLDNGHLLASHDFFGDGVSVWKTAVSSSTDGGLTWSSPVEISHMYWASMFEYNDDVYLLGVYSPGGDIAISKSSDEGATWTSTDNGILFSCGTGTTPPNYTTGSVPVLIHNGRVYRSFEDQDTTLDSKFKALVISASLDDDLLSSNSWVMSNKVEYDVSNTPVEWGATLPVWLEGSVTVDADGQIWLLERFNSYPTTEKAALLSLSSDGRTLLWDVDGPDSGFIDMLGGMHKFAVKHDSITGLSLAIVNNNTDLNEPQQRNTLSLIASADLKNWRYVLTLIQDNSIMSWDDSIDYSGFQYVDWEFDGEDIIYLSRTAYDGADSYHNANRITFHRLENYAYGICSCGY